MGDRNIPLAETAGTFVLVFIGCGAIIVNDIYNGALGHVGVSLAFGLVVMSMIYAIGNISGAHMNPAVTLGFLLAGRLKWHAVPSYVASQILGAVAASALLAYLFPQHLTLGTTQPAASASQAFVMEVLLSFCLMFVILCVTVKENIMAGIVIGGVIAMDALVGGPVSGASMNPARSLGPALVSGNLESLWIYLIAPVAGALLASPTCRRIQGGECCSTLSNRVTG